VIIDRDGERPRASISRAELGVNLAIAALVLVLLAVSLWSVYETSSRALVLALTGGWGFAAGAAGWYKRSWLWPALFPVAMLAVILLWAAAYGRSSWASAFVTVLGTMFAVAATIGALIGTWLGKRRYESS
jgi:hypothetical protein